MTENTGQKQGGRFRPGQSGNPAGKPKGARNRTTMALEKLLDADAKRLTQAAINAALGGDMTALRLCLDRLLPPRRERPLPSLALPPVRPGDVAQASRAVIDAAARGLLTPSEAAAYGTLLEGFRRSVEADELATRVSAIEAQLRAQDECA